MPAPSSPHDRPSHESNADNHTAYDQLILLCLREAGAATELLRGTKGLGLSSPEAQALASDMLEAQRDFVCALALWDRADDALAFRCIFGKDEEAHQYGWRLRSRRTRCARPCDAWPGRPCCQELSVGSVACTQMLECSAEAAMVAFAAWRGRTVA